MSTHFSVAEEILIFSKNGVLVRPSVRWRYTGCGVKRGKDA